MSNASGLAIFDTFPEIKRLGKSAVQRLCDAWLATPLAREFAVSTLTVDDNLLLSFECQLTHRFQDGEAYYFPVDRLLHYIADNGVSDSAEREKVERRIASAREQGGPDVFRRFKIHTGPKLPLFVTCENCGNVMQTQWSAYRCEKVRIENGEVECTKCGHVFPIDGSELHFEPGS
jgi:predicted RNA-binding Zn-ribbon protein involved in translation (DUF1610 family)